ncbi:tRNA adenosine(34) deaminase TadA [Kurthia sibirica]|uniref:tRNA-specific adenosine deaminase n=1 Tax=Kurthia sibirica TaxID=202750 RepID=A0A2U3AFD3_9BACL|nr:tRNA adenosine(34) deaminase TadA [Kurthia sibirica]PWI23249.1 tRNA-specific adenosine deaminase [Kurthia sibirica]GEK35540.1 tRNA-specific adenosine deaminase [Kurthia sibirica]
MILTDEEYMAIAFEEAQKAAEIGEVPIGAIIVYEGEVIARAHNLREATRNAVMHAELMAIQEACTIQNRWRLEDTTLYVTLEPCPMCAGAILQSRIPRVVYGARDHKAGSVHSLYNLLSDNRLNHECDITEGILQQQCSQLLSDFFKALRNRKKEEKRLRKLKDSQEE